MSRNNRRYAFTVFDYDWEADPTAEHALSELPANVAFVNYQVEETPTTHRKHLQGYIRFKAPEGMGAVKRLFGDSAHVEICRGTEQANIDYVSKDATRLFGPYRLGQPTAAENGGEAQQGHRSDLAVACDAVKAGSFNPLEHPETFVRYGPGLNRLQAVVEAAKSTTIRPDPVTLTIIGPTGIGKSHFVWSAMLGSGMDSYVLPYPSSTSHAVFWPGYNGQKILFLDEYRGQLPLSDFLKVTDKYPVQVRTDTTAFRWLQVTHIFITCNDPPDWWYPAASEASKAALLRRCGRIETCSSREDLKNLWRTLELPVHQDWT